MLLGLTVPKLLLILFIGLVVFGPGKLPKVGKSLGESLRAFKAAKGMIKNRHLAKAVAAQRFHRLLTKLKRKAESIGIEFRIADRFYPSSKTCHACGHIHKGLKLKDRVYVCPACGYTEDRDINASINLRDAEEYRVA